MSTKGKVKGIISNLVMVEADGPVAQNEICYIDLNGVRLMAEVLKVTGNNVSVQVFESTRGLKVGNDVEFMGHMLEVTLGPGLLSCNFDGLQNDLNKLTGVFLKRGEYNFPLDRERKWQFTPLAQPGDQVEAASWLGQVDENAQPHKIMVPFTFKGTYTVKSIVPADEYTILDTVHSSCWKPACAPSTPPTPSPRAERASSPAPSAQGRPCCSMPSPSRPMPTS